MAENPQVVLETDKGSITVELYSEKTPDTVANFLKAVESGYYAGTIFHRVIKGFMIQCGGLDADMDDKDWDGEPVKNEAPKGVSNERGTIAMARTMDPHSATTQFFINTVGNDRLDHTSESTHGWGYCAFGRVVKGMDVVDAIEGVETTDRAGHQNVPVDPVAITGASVVKTKKKTPAKAKSKVKK